MTNVFMTRKETDDDDDNYFAYIDSTTLKRSYTLIEKPINDDD